ncbi:MAG: efflux RND transporter permease subunit, partial [Candidatus Aureabacteria bacterium]|nr:efflux RND transporter permease subunit [Candidatus Auribacterota bacterium]
TLMMYLGIVLLGIISWFKLPQDLFPPVSYPQVTIVTTYPNAAPEEVETLITRPIEEAISTVNNLKGMRSVSREGLSLVTAEFGWNAKMDFAALGVRQKIDLIKERLPREAKEPVVKKINPFDLPILVISLRGKLPQEKLYQYGKKVLKEALSKVEGVASVAIQGGCEPEIFVDVDAAMLRARNIDVTKIGRILDETNLNYPAGTTKEGSYEYLIRTEGEFETVDEIGRTIIDVDYSEVREEPDGEKRPVGVVRLSDIAEIKKGFSETTSLSRFNGEENILISVFKQSDANTIRTVKKLREKLQSLELLKNIPVETSIVYDKSIFIQDSISNLKTEGFQGGVLAFIILLFFLQSFYASAIVMITIPVSLIATLIFMYFSGISINMMSLGGLALGVGMLIDSAIASIENTVRKNQKEGLPPKEAAVEGVSQIWASLFASTLTSVAVFLPMIFLTGIEGQLFKELAFGVCISSLVAFIVALTLVPRLTYRIHWQTSPYSFFKRCEKWVDRLGMNYEKGLHHVMAHKVRYFIVVGFLFLTAVLLIYKLPKEMIPQVDEGQFGIKVTLPPGTKLQITDKEVRKIENLLLENPDIENVSVNIGSKSSDAMEGSQMLGSHQAQLTVVLKETRSVRTNRFIDSIYQQAEKLTSAGTHLEFKMTSTGMGSSFSFKAPVSVEIQSENLEELNRQAKRVWNRLSQIPELINLQSTLSDPMPETKIKVDKERAALLGLSARDISIAAQTAIKGMIATYFKDKNGLEIPVRVRLDEKDRMHLDQIENIPIWTDRNMSVFLGDVMEFSEGVGPSEILRINQNKMVVITADVINTVILEDIREKIRNVILDLPVIEDVHIRLIEATPEEKAATFGMIFMLLLSVLLVYMIMAAQFESFLQPFIIMVTVPLGIIGVSYALALTGNSLNIVAGLGAIMLGGIVVNNGIVLIEFINECRKEDSDIGIDKVVFHSCQVRFKPILMSTVCEILALLPLAFGFGGQGSELQSPMAISVIGGLLVSTTLTLFILPCLYVSAEQFRAGIKNANRHE